MGLESALVSVLAWEHVEQALACQLVPYWARYWGSNWARDLDLQWGQMSELAMEHLSCFQEIETVSCSEIQMVEWWETQTVPYSGEK